MSLGRGVGMVLVFSAFGTGYLATYPFGVSRTTWFVIVLILLVAGGLLLYLARERPAREPPMLERTTGQFGADGITKTAAITASGVSAVTAGSESNGGDGGD